MFIWNYNLFVLKVNVLNVYVVKKGDILWDIFKCFLNNFVCWFEIWVSNRYVKNLYWIFLGDCLLMCIYEGCLIIGKDEGDGCEGIICCYIGGIKF